MQSPSHQPLPASYLFQTQTRSEHEIALTNKLAMALSQLNIRRVTAQSSEEFYKPRVKFYFVCICGIPPFDDEYEDLQLPGEKVVISLNGLRGDYTEEQYIEIFRKGGFEEEAAKIRSQILAKSNDGYRIVVLYHSFGSFSLINYVRLYGSDHRISGLIDLGGATIRLYPLLYNFIRDSYQLTPEQLLQNADQVHAQLQNNPDRVRAGFNHFKNKYQSILQVKLATEKSFQQMFLYFRNLPGVLKLFVYGASDRIFPQHLINQKVVHYSYRREFDQGYAHRLRNSYRECYGTECRNVQERFIFRLEGGGHSIHMQRRFRPLLRQAIRQYLQVLEGALQ